MSQPWVYVMELEIHELAVNVMLNGISVIQDPNGASHFVQLKVNPFVIEGDNQFSVYMAHPEGGRATPGSKCNVRFFRGVQGQLPDPKDELARFEYVFGETELEDEGYALVHNEMVPVDRADGRWAWEDADPYTEHDRPAVIDLVVRLHSALEARDVNTLMTLNTLRIQEFSRALHEPEADMVTDQRQTFDELFAHQEWKVAPLDPDTLVVAPGAQGRVVQVLDETGTPPLRGEAGEDTGFVMATYLSKLSQGWTLVR